MLNASHSQMNRAALSALSTNSTPPRTFGWFASTPTTRPFRRANPVSSSPAKNSLISHHEPSSINASTSSRMSNGLFWFAGIISAIARCGAGSCAAATGGCSVKFCGR